MQRKHKALKLIFLEMALIILASTALQGCKKENAADFISTVKGDIRLGMGMNETMKKLGITGEATKLGKYKIYYAEDKVYDVSGYKYIIFDGKGTLVGISFSYRPDRYLGTEAYQALMDHFEERIDYIKEVYGEPTELSPVGHYYIWGVNVDNCDAYIIYKYPLADKAKFESVYLVASLIDKDAFEQIGQAIGLGVK